MLSVRDERHAALRKSSLGQGQNSGTLFTDQGAFPCIVPYEERVSELRREAPLPRKGSRAMHQTTMAIANPTVLDYATTSHQMHGGSRFLPVPQRQPKARSMHASQIVFGQQQQQQSSDNAPPQSHTSQTYATKEVQPHYQVHYPIVINKINSVESRDVRTILQPDSFTNYFTQYRRTHSLLGSVLESAADPSLKSAVPRPYVPNQRFHVLTGEPVGDAWNPNNRRISGNRLLEQARLAVARCNTLG